MTFSEKKVKINVYFLVRFNDVKVSCARNTLQDRAWS
uniref:Uncharacterized protein n=1 Tax=Rhizophora mucronata TaxID=61149 RepID=A0A2P2NCM8_RHIMU